MGVDVSKFIDTFLGEGADHVARIEEGLLALEGPGSQRETLDAIFRSVHSIKGGSGVFGLTDIARFTHVFENVLDRLRTHGAPCDRALTGILLEANDVLKGLLDAAPTKGPAPERTAAVLERLNRLIDEPAPSSVESASTDVPRKRRLRVRFRPSLDVFRQGIDPQFMLRELAELGTIESTAVDATRLPGDQEAFDPEACYLGWVIVIDTDATLEAVRNVFLFAEDGADLEVAPLVEASPAEPSPTPGPLPEALPPVFDRRRGPDRRRAFDGVALRVSTEKVDRLIDLVGEIVIAQSIVADLTDDFKASRLAQLRDAMAQLERNTRDLQECVLGIRMVPIGSVFSHYPRLVRDLASGLGKSVRVEITGEETELDKGVVERISDALTHLVRNAVDHGFEMPDSRVAAGKPAEGVLKLSSSTRGGTVTIEVSDDGRGLDPERIRMKAQAKGLIEPEQHLSPEALQQLIFLPGFSTTDQVSDLSGRGVGMDVVKRSVTSLNGTIAIDSRAGRGTSIRINLPLTLAIMDGQSLAVGNTVYVLPLMAIVESLRPRPSDIVTIGGTAEVVYVRGEAIPLVRLDRRLGVKARYADPAAGIVVLVEHQGRRTALLVDELRGQRQVVIKNLDAHYQRVDGVMGATIMGDGSVALILDVPGLLRSSDAAPMPPPTGAAGGMRTH